MESLDLPNMIRTNNYYNHISYIKNYENTLQKVFKSQNNSNLKNNNNIFLHPINKNKNINMDLFENMIDFNYDSFGLQFFDKNDSNGIVVIGPHIRNCLINVCYDTEIFVRNEIYVFKYINTKWIDIIENLSEYTEKENEYVLEKDDKKIYLIKKKYFSTSQILLQHDYIKRIGWENGTFYVSSMCLIEYQRHKQTIISKVKDPILNIPYDPLCIYHTNNNNNNKDITKIIDSVDLEELTKISEKYITKIYNNKTLFELCVDKYMKEDSEILLEILEKMIIFLMYFKMKRPNSYYVKCVNLHKKNKKLSKFVCDNDTKCANVPNNLCGTCKNINEINNMIVDYFIKQDNPHFLIEFLGSIQQKINKQMLEKIINYKANTIITELIENRLIDEYMTYYLILMSGNIELINMINFDINIAINFLEDIITNGIYESFLYLIENDETIATSFFDNKQNIFHIIKTKKDYEKIIEKMICVHPELLNTCDEFGETPLIYHSRENPILLDVFLKYDITDLTVVDNEGNTCLHNLCKHNEPKILKNVLKKYPELINMPNLKSDYPIIECCKSKLENIFYILKNCGADLNVRDIHGNTCYHYICNNAICLGSEIKNIQNFFGATPKDYSKGVIAQSFYIFTEVPCEML